MTYQEALAVAFFAWGSGYVLGYKLRQIQDALAAS